MLLSSDAKGPNLSIASQGGEFWASPAQRLLIGLSKCAQRLYSLRSEGGVE
jgi:hypothetical protein